MSPPWRRAWLGATSHPVAADSHGKRAPARPTWLCRLSCGLEAADPGLQHCAGRRGVRGGEERQHEDVAVPEDVPAVALDPERPRAPTAASPSVGHRRHQVKQREAHVPLQLGVALDHDVRVARHRRPHDSRCSASMFSNPSFSARASAALGLLFSRPTRPSRSSTGPCLASAMAAWMPGAAMVLSPRVLAAGLPVLG